MPINVSKIKKELSKGSAVQQFEAFKEIKEHVVSSLTSAQSHLQENVNGLQDLINQVKSPN